MPYWQTRDILRRAQDFHSQLSDFYHQLADDAKKTTVTMLLEYMSRHEKHLEESLAKYEESAASDILDCWFKYVPELATCKCFEGIEVGLSMSVDDVVNMAMRLDNCLVNLYREVAECANAAQVKEVFSALLEMEEQEKVKLIREALEFAHT